MITQAVLKALFTYSQDTGLFTSNLETPQREVGQIVGSKRADGYLSVMINGKNYLLHRLAFLYMEGCFPTHLVDHINGIRGDNRWINLRHADSSLNARNCKISSNNLSGVVGVSWHKAAQKWQAFVSVDAKPVYLGLFETIEAANLAREIAMKLHNYPEVNREF